MFEVEVPSEIQDLAGAGLVVSAQVSGGKDSMAAGHVAFRALETADIPFERGVMHSDLGLLEHPETPAAVELTAAQLGAPLQVIPAKGNGLTDRFWTRGRGGRERWINLETYHLIGPFSSPTTPFCQSESKASRLNRLTGQLYPKRNVIHVIGLRKNESSRRRGTPTIKRLPNDLFAHGVRVWAWYPIAEWTAEQVFEYHRIHNLPLHPAYTLYGSSRVSCSLCVMQSSADSAAAARNTGNLPALREMFAIETFFGFSYQHERWAGDVFAKWQPEHFSDAHREALERAKWAADARRAIEAAMPPDLKYVNGWPVRMPDVAEAEAIAHSRMQLGEVLGIQPLYVTTDDVLARFDGLLRAKYQKAVAKTGLFALAA